MGYQFFTQDLELLPKTVKEISVFDPVSARMLEKTPEAKKKTLRIHWGNVTNK